jgi:hypothetical protein
MDFWTGPIHWPIRPAAITLVFKISKMTNFHTNFDIKWPMKIKIERIFQNCGPMTVFLSVNITVRLAHRLNEFDIPVFNCQNSKLKNIESCKIYCRSLNRKTNLKNIVRHFWLTRRSSTRKSKRDLWKTLQKSAWLSYRVSHLRAPKQLKKIKIKMALI